MTRFFVSREDMLPDTLLLTGENAAHARVLRLKQGDTVMICDGRGQECRCVVNSMNSAEVELSVIARGTSLSEACVRVSVYMALPKGDKLEYVIQKATELGAAEIVAFPSARCVSRPDDKSLKKKLERWQKIAAAAAEQSGRGVIPAVRFLPSYDGAVREAAQAQLPVLFYENEDGLTLSDAIKHCGELSTVSILTGPEGGLETYEVEMARKAGLRICTLGRRILRCETAPLCALSAVMFAAGEF